MAVVYWSNLAPHCEGIRRFPSTEYPYFVGDVEALDVEAQAAALQAYSEAMTDGENDIATRN